MVPVVANYANGSNGLALACYIASGVALAVFFGAQFYLASLLLLKQERPSMVWINAFIIASVWVSFELLRATIFSALPWLSYTAGISQARSIYLLQPAAFGGVFLLSFIIVITAYFLAVDLINRKVRFLVFAVGILAIQYATGALLFNKFSAEIEEDNPAHFSVALVMPALSPETVWNDESANAVVSHLLALNEKAVATKPDMAVWTETVVPWAYSPDDDFLKEISNTTANTNTLSLLGMNSSLDQSETNLSNSVYLLSNTGKELGKYDKQDLLSMAEKPLLASPALILPFIKKLDLKMEAGSNSEPVNTPWGKAGIMICNESTNSFHAAGLAKSGAEFLVNMGNDSWFSDYFITTQHFYNARCRAVENRKDLIINNNRGICGVVKSTGEIKIEEDGRNSNVISAEIHPNKLQTFKLNNLVYPAITILLLVLGNYLQRVKFNPNKNKTQTQK